MEGPKISKKIPKVSDWISKNFQKFVNQGRRFYANLVRDIRFWWYFSAFFCSFVFFKSLLIVFDVHGTPIIFRRIIENFWKFQNLFDCGDVMTRSDVLKRLKVLVKSWKHLVIENNLIDSTNKVWNERKKKEKIYPSYMGRQQFYKCLYIYKLESNYTIWQTWRGQATVTKIKSTSEKRW